jgi:Transposase IS4
MQLTRKFSSFFVFSLNTLNNQLKLLKGTMVDPHRVVGNTITAKACHVTNLAECARRYGSNKSTKLLDGVVIEVAVVQNHGNNRTTTNIIADYNLGDCVKRASHNIRCIQAKETAGAAFDEETIPDDAVVENRLVNDAVSLGINVDPICAAAPAPKVPLEIPLIEPTVLVDNTIVDSTSTTELHDSGILYDDASMMQPNRDAGNYITAPHGERWYKDDSATQQDVNGMFPYRAWGVKTPIGDHLGAGSNVCERLSRLDIFLLMFPPTQLETMLLSTNTLLHEHNKKTTTKGELLIFFGIILLATKYEFKSRASLWSNSPPTKYENAPGFGKTGMSRVRFDDIWRFIRWSSQPDERQEGMSSERYRWMLVDDFVENFNSHRAAAFVPSDLICVDESISRWYGQGGDWINHGLPMYIAIDRKPENGCEIQNSACGRSGVMLRLKIVKSAKEELNNTHNDRIGLLHGTKVLKYLIEPWNFSDRMVCADSYFASVGAAEELKRLGMRFIGVVKTATRRFPMAYLSGVELQQRGDRQGVITKDNEGKPSLLAFVWMDQERRYFIASGSSLKEGTPYIRDQWRQVSLELNADPTKVQLTVPQPKAAEVYYAVCSKIDQHNRDRQDTLMIERKLQTHDWSMRLNLSLLAIIFVDSWRVYSQITFPVNNAGELQKIESQKEFYGNLAAELIDNSFDRIGMRNRCLDFEHTTHEADSVIDKRNGLPRFGTAAHLTPTKRKRKRKDGSNTNYSFQGRCRVCSFKTMFECSLCKDNPETQNESWLCSTIHGKMCFPNHLAMYHNT